MSLRLDYEDARADLTTTENELHEMKAKLPELCDECRSNFD
jgi:hypothetical protein